MAELQELEGEFNKVNKNIKLVDLYLFLSFLGLTRRRKQRRK